MGAERELRVCTELGSLPRHAARRRATCVPASPGHRGGGEAPETLGEDEVVIEMGTVDSQKNKRQNLRQPYPNSPWDWDLCQKDPPQGNPKDRQKTMAVSLECFGYISKFFSHKRPTMYL